MDQEVIKRSENLPYEDTFFKPIEKSNDFQVLESPEKKTTNNTSSNNINYHSSNMH